MTFDCWIKIVILEVFLRHQQLGALARLVEGDAGAVAGIHHGQQDDRHHDDARRG